MGSPHATKPTYTWAEAYALWKRLAAAHAPDLAAGFATINVRVRHGAGFDIDAVFVPRGTVGTEEGVMQAVLLDEARDAGARQTATLLARSGHDAERTAAVFIGAAATALRMADGLRDGRVAAGHVTAAVQSTPSPPKWHHSVRQTFPAVADLLSGEIDPIVSVRTPDDVVRVAFLQALACRAQTDVVARVLIGHEGPLPIASLPQS